MNTCDLETWNLLTSEQQRDTLVLVPSQTRMRFNRQSNGSVGWAAWSWNPVTGCFHTCTYCYARVIANRFFGTFTPTLHLERLAIPSSHRPPSTSAALSSRLVFTVSMGDLFGTWVPQLWIDAVFEAIRKAPNWTFLLLTKNPQRLIGQEFPPNVWVGATVDTQARAEHVARVLPQVSATVRWLSCEPLLEPLVFPELLRTTIAWVVIGSQTRTPRAAARHPDSKWVGSLTQQFQDVGAAVYHKDNLLVDGIEQLKDYPLTYWGL